MNGPVRLALYSSGRGSADTPLLLLHSVNAAASAFEVKPLFDRFAIGRPVYALELPGFGHSERKNRRYSVELMTDAILAAAREIFEIHNRPLDAIALSLSCEFLAKASIGQPALFRSLGFISPTGFEGKARDEAGGTRGQQWLLRVLNFPLWGKAVFALLTTKPVIRKFLEKTWGASNIDEALLQYDILTAHQPNARYAPFYFVSGFLFSKDILRIYESIESPIWMVHGTRGDFVDYHHKERVAHKPNWTIQVMETGAFPHFEKPEQVVSSYRQFCQGLKG